MRTLAYRRNIEELQAGRLHHVWHRRLLVSTGNICSGSRLGENTKSVFDVPGFSTQPLIA